MEEVREGGWGEGTDMPGAGGNCWGDTFADSDDAMVPRARSPWKFGDLIQEPLPRPVDLHVHFFLKIPFKSISHFAQINIWNLGHVILLFKKKSTDLHS